MKVKEESEKVGLKVSIQKTKIMASSSITSQQINAEKLETATDFILLGSKITADGDCSHKIKRCLFLGRKTMRKLDSILKSRDSNHSAHKGLSSQSYGFSSSLVWMSELDHNRWLRGEELIAFELWCWRRLLRVSSTTRRSNQLILKEINPEFSLEGLMLKLKLRYSGHLM